MYSKRKIDENRKELPFWIFYNPEFLGQDIYVEEFGYGICMPGYIFTETRKNYLMEIVLDGISHVSLGKNPQFSVKKGEAFLLPPNVYHWYKSDSTYPTTKVWISWSGKLAPQIEKQLGYNKNPYLVNINDVEKIKKIFRKLKNSRNNTTISLATIYSCFYEILSCCIEKTNIIATSKTLEDQLISNIIQYIDNHLYDNVSIQTISDNFGYDVSTIFRKFKRKMGLSPKEYITHRKLSLAKGLICETNTKTEEIIYLCGYTNKNALNELFLRYEKLSLSKYIESHRIK